MWSGWRKKNRRLRKMLLKKKLKALKLAKKDREMTQRDRHKYLAANAQAVA